jgi:ribonuclease D
LTNHLHEGDLPEGALAGAASVAVDSETMGLVLGRDPLCVVQLSAGDGDAHVVRLRRPAYDAPNLKRLLTDPAVVKIFHFGRFDIAMSRRRSTAPRSPPSWCAPIPTATG